MQLALLNQAVDTNAMQNKRKPKRKEIKKICFHQLELFLPLVSETESKIIDFCISTGIKIESGLGYLINCIKNSISFQSFISNKNKSQEQTISSCLPLTS